MHTTIRQKCMVLFCLFFLLCTTIQQKYMVFFHLFFLLGTIIRPKNKIHTDLFLMCTWPFGQKLGSSLIYFICTWPFYQKLESSLIYVFHLHTTIWQKYMIFFISFILSLCMTIRPKISVLINLFFLFVHDCSTKVRGHSYS